MLKEVPVVSINTDSWRKASAPFPPKLKRDSSNLRLKFILTKTTVNLQPTSNFRETTGLQSANVNNL